MGIATSYQTASYTNKFEFDITSQSTLVRSFAFDPTDSATTVVEITGQNNYGNNWKATKGSNNVIVFETNAGNALELGSNDTQHFFAFLSHAMSAANKIYWISDTDATINADAADASAVYSVTPNDFNITLIAGQGSGDPRINPYINPYKEPLILPPNNKIYNYLSYQSEEEKITINASMWMLSFDRIVFAEELYRDLTLPNKPELATDEKRHAYKIAIENITKFPLKKISANTLASSFIRYITIIYQKSNDPPQELTIDMETLHSDKSFQAPFKLTHPTPMFSPELSMGIKKFERDKTDSFYKTLTLQNTVTFGDINLTLIRDTNRLNHRNSISIRFETNRHTQDILRLNVKGAIIHPDTVATVPTASTTDPELFHKEPTPQLLSEYTKENKEKLRKRRHDIRAQVRKHDFGLLF